MQFTGYVNNFNFFQTLASIHNYEFFDPKKLTNYCATYMKKLCETGKLKNYVEIWEAYKGFFCTKVQFDDYLDQLSMKDDFHVAHDFNEIAEPNYREKLLRSMCIQLLLCSE